MSEPARTAQAGRARTGTARRHTWIVVWLIVAACGGGVAALPLGEEAVVEHAQLVGDTFAPKTTLAISVLAVRTGTIAELEAGFEIDPDQRTKTPIYVDARFENRGSQAINRELGVSLEDQDGNLISNVVIFNYGGDVFAPCPDNTEGELAPGEQFETCSLFLVDEGRTPTRVSFLPLPLGNDTVSVYWSVP